MMDLASLMSFGAAGVAGGGLTLFGQLAIGWFSSRAQSHTADRDADVRLDSQRDKLTFDLLAAARQDSAALRNELADLRVISARAVHLEEALDHLEAILVAEGEHERLGAERRARAFLKRMRPTVGDLRQEIQRQESARQVSKKITGEPEGELP